MAMLTNPARHLGHIICLHAGRAVYVPKAETLQETLRIAAACFDFDEDTDLHLGFPHPDLAMLIEISEAAYANVRDGAMLYLCVGKHGPILAQDLAIQARAALETRLQRASYRSIREGRTAAELDGSADRDQFKEKRNRPLDQNPIVVKNDTESDASARVLAETPSTRRAGITLRRQRSGVASEEPDNQSTNSLRSDRRVSARRKRPRVEG